MTRITKVLVANRGEIAVRIIRAAKDAGISAVAVYADQDRNARFVRLAHEAYALNGRNSQETYLVAEKILSIAKRSGANAIHPGYGFLSENADFAQMVNDANLIWIGPPPAAIRSLGDKVSARHIAHEAGAPLAPGTPDPVTSADEVLRLRMNTVFPLPSKLHMEVAVGDSKLPKLWRKFRNNLTLLFGRHWPLSAAENALWKNTSRNHGTSRPNAWPTLKAT